MPFTCHTLKNKCFFFFFFFWGGGGCYWGGGGVKITLKQRGSVMFTFA